MVSAGRPLAELIAGLDDANEKSRVYIEKQTAAAYNLQRVGMATGKDPPFDLFGVPPVHKDHSFGGKWLHFAFSIVEKPPHVVQFILEYINADV